MEQGGSGRVCSDGTDYQPSSDVCLARLMVEVPRGDGDAAWSPRLSHSPTWSSRGDSRKCGNSWHFLAGSDPFNAVLNSNIRENVYRFPSIFCPTLSSAFTQNS